MTQENSSFAWRLPAEWEWHRGIVLTWPHADTDWAPMLDEVEQTYRQLARAIGQSKELLHVVSPRQVWTQTARGRKRVGDFYTLCPTNDTWTRDHFFITLVRGTEEQRRQHCPDIPLPDRRMLDYCFNGWGRKFPAELDNAINRHFYEQRPSMEEYVDCRDFVLEGGSIESDGRGTVMTTSACLLAPNRNQPMSRQEIEERLKRDLHAERVLWIDHGQLTGDDTDGHIDTLVRMCPDDTLLYIGCDNPDDEQYDELKAMEEQLRTFRTLEGKPYTLLRLPMPDPILDEDGQRLPATYANFLITNTSVICPTYGQARYDKQALSAVASAFPGRRVVGIDSRSLIRQHGSIHCSTMQLP